MVHRPSILSLGRGLLAACALVIAVAGVAPARPNAARASSLSVSSVLATGFPVLPNHTFAPSTSHIDVTFSEPVDPSTAQVPGNYGFGGPVPHNVITATLDGVQPNLVHLAINGTMAPNAAFYQIVVTGVEDLELNPIVNDGIGNIGKFFIQLVGFRGSMKQGLCNGELHPSDAFAIEGALAPLTFTVGDNAYLYDPDGDSTYTTSVPIVMAVDPATGRAEADLSWKFSHLPATSPLEPGANRSTHLSSANGPNVTVYGAWAGEPSVCLDASDFRLNQLDVQLSGSTFLNAAIANCNFVYVAPPERGFFNLVARLPGSPQFGWVLRNVFLPDSAEAAPLEHFTLAFPLTVLGIPDGIPCPPLEISFRLSGQPVADVDTTVWFSGLSWYGPIPVNHVAVQPGGAQAQLFIAPGVPFPAGPEFPSFDPATTINIWSSIGCTMPNIDLDDWNHPGDWNGCVPAACANSMRWLTQSNPRINLPPDLRHVYEQLSNLMYRDTRRNAVTPDSALRAKLDLIEAYGLPIRVTSQSAINNARGPIKSTSGLTTAQPSNTGLWPTFKWLTSEAADSEDIETIGGFWYDSLGKWVRVGGHSVVISRVGATDGHPWISYKHDADQGDEDSTRVVQESAWVDTTGGIMHVPTLDFPYQPDGSDSTFHVKYLVETVMSESYDPAVLPPSGQHTFTAYCQEFRRTIAPGQKLTITYPNDNTRCFNSTVSELDRSAPKQPGWSKTHEWNFNSGKAREYVNNTDHCVTIAVHNDDHGPSSGPYPQFTVNLATAPASSPRNGPRRVEEASSPDNPEVFGGFSLGGTTGAPDEFGAPAGPVAAVDGSIGCQLADVPGTLGGAVQQLSLVRPIPAWNSYWSHVGLNLVVSSVAAGGMLQVDCPSSGFSGTIPVTAPGVYTADLGTIAPTSTFSLSLAATAGLMMSIDAIGVPSLQDVIAGTHREPVPLVAGLWNLGPNPASADATLRFDLPRSGIVRLGVYDLSGRRVAALVSGRKEAGSYTCTWNASNSAGRQVPSGLYFCRLQIDNQSWTTRITIVR